MSTENIPTQETPIPTPATPIKQKTGIGKVITGIEKVIEAPVLFVGKEAGILAKLFASQEPAIQADLKIVSGIVQILKVDIAETPDVLVYAIKKAYPTFDIATLNTYLASAAKDLGMAIDVVDPTLQGTISAIQSHVPSLQTIGAKANFWTGMANLLGQLVAPNTPWGYVVTILVYVYNNFIKPK